MTVVSSSVGGQRSAAGALTSSALLLLICGIAAVFRFTGLAWGAPYFHFHIDEHFVFTGAELLRRSLREASMSPKFFMYGPLPMWMLNATVAVHDQLFGPLALTVKQDEITYMVLGRTISAVLGTACVPLVYVATRRVAGRAAGLIAALLLACAVVQLRESHFFSVDIAMLFFSMGAWLFAVRIAETGDLRDYLLAGLCLGAAVACKYSAGFLVGVLGVAHLVAPGRPRQVGDLRGWGRWVVRGVSPLLVAALVFAAVDPMAILYFAKFKQDVNDWIIEPGSGTFRPIFIAQFTDVQPQRYWFINLLWWGLGPAFEICGLVGVAWLLVRRDRRSLSLVAASFPIMYYLAAAQTVAPHMRYAVPLAAGLAAAAGVLSADLLQRPRLRLAATAIIVVVCGTTALYAAAYLRVFQAPDSRLTAATWLIKNVPRDSKLLVEPSHNIPPMGSYLTAVDFNRDYVLWRSAEKHEYYRLYSLDTYQYLYDRRTRDDDRRHYIQSRLAMVDWIVMDDTFLQFYEHLPENRHGVMKQYYRDLFAGRLGFTLVQSFKVYPSLFGRQINDDDAELSARLFDHPRVFVFARNAAASRMH